jgi:hypothetical protein
MVTSLVNAAQHLEEVTDLARRSPGLELLLLFGSRARGDDQAAIDLAVSACIHFRLGAPTGYGAAFSRLAEAGYLDPGLAARLVRAAGFRNVVAHAYDTLDMGRVHRSAREGPAGLRGFLGALAERI